MMQKGLKRTKVSLKKPLASVRNLGHSDFGVLIMDFDYVDNRRKAHLIKHHLDALKDLGVDMPGTQSA